MEKKQIICYNIKLKIYYLRHLPLKGKHNV